ncbi:hypothetical protein AALO_G00259650 [Alosa alosa]|uniref:THAP-type domain-containing protein n=1 Tax=Alosa alosa TaxID=278164 RepID=A0AAV6FUU6_9TELE|nr:uncharacterized protein LOC125285292 [Alosa alosa]KAG5264937.1 hypothetical protein AALO_G00259650 [Alosa alosa]
MPCCAAYGCSVQPGRGKRLHYFPREPTRRKLWEQRVRRKNWKANNFSLLCEDHFDETQYESHRADGLRKLKPNAIPTQFVFTKPKTSRSRRPPNRHITNSVALKDVMVSDGATKKVSQDHSYCSTSLDTAQPEIHRSEPSADDGTEQGIPDCNPNSINVDLPSNNPTQWVCLPHASCPVMSCEEKLKALANKVLRLQQTLAKERREKWKILKQRKQLEEKVSRVFNKDQLAKLCQSSTRGTKWSDDTIKKGLQLQLVCGVAGYELLLAQKQPLPSVRSLRRVLVLEKKSPSL